MKFAPFDVGLRNTAAPAKNEPCNVPGGSSKAAPSCVIGNPPCARTNWEGRGSTSNIPKPPRRAVLPLWNGSQANPTRGSKLRYVGFDIKGEPRCSVESVM